tara:strand:- start:453 stop:563 length:111 start_codon:yes stop_codon:yes gene_type:complete
MTLFDWAMPEVRAIALAGAVATFKALMLQIVLLLAL